MDSNTEVFLAAIIICIGAAMLYGVIAIFREGRRMGKGHLPAILRRPGDPPIQKKEVRYKVDLSMWDTKARVTKIDENDEPLSSTTYYKWGPTDISSVMLILCMVLLIVFMVAMGLIKFVSEVM